MKKSPLQISNSQLRTLCARLEEAFLRNNLNPKIKDNFPLADTLLASYGIIISEDTKFEYENKKMSPQSAGILIHNIHHYMLAPPFSKKKARFWAGFSPYGRF